MEDHTYCLQHYPSPSPSPPSPPSPDVDSLTCEADGAIPHEETVIDPTEEAPKSVLTSCSFCFTTEGKFIVCSQCRVATYCGRKCRRLAQPFHHRACSLLVHIPDKLNEFMIQHDATVDTILKYLTSEVKNYKSPWNFTKFRIGRTKNGPFQLFSLLHGQLPITEDTLRAALCAKIFKRQGLGFICIDDACDHATIAWNRKEKCLKHLYKKYAIFVCSRCSAVCRKKTAFCFHQIKKCKGRREKFVRCSNSDSVTDSDSSSDSESDSDYDSDSDSDPGPDSNENEGFTYDCLKLITNSDEKSKVFTTFFKNALKLAHQDGLLEQFEKVDDLMRELMNDIRRIDLIIMAGDVIRCSEKKDCLEMDKIKCLDNYFKIYIDDRTSFQIVELTTKKSVSVDELKRRLKKSCVKDGDAYKCAHKMCCCSGAFRRREKSLIFSHIERSNYSLVCCGCNSAFKALSALKEHPGKNCHSSKILDKKVKVAKNINSPLRSVTLNR